jgi:hypothetical protein
MIVVTFEYYTVDDHSTQMMMQKGSFRKAQTPLNIKKKLIVIPAAEVMFRQKIFRSRCAQHHTYSTHTKEKECSLEDSEDL